jgi:hypothetical protein
MPTLVAGRGAAGGTRAAGRELGIERTDVARGGGMAHGHLQKHRLCMPLV